MVTTSQLVKRHIAGLPQGAIFCTRDLLGYGKRNIIDNLLYRLVKKQRLTRLARGVFSKSSRRDSAVSPWDIIEAKLKAWGKVYWKLERKNDPSLSASAKSITVHVSGSSSSFQTEDGVRCHLQGTGQRLMKLGASQAGQLARQIWLSGKQQFLPSSLCSLLLPLQAKEKTAFLCLFKLLPAWINDSLFRVRLLRFGASFSEVCRLGTESTYCQLEARRCAESVEGAVPHRLDRQVAQIRRTVTVGC